MKALLMHPDRDFAVKQQLPPHHEALTQDLELETLLRTMAVEDEFLLDVARQAILSGFANDVPTILYRQHVLQDCLDNEATVRKLYALAVDAIAEEKKKHHFGFLGNYPSGVLYGSVEVLQLFVGVLRNLRALERDEAGRFQSEAFRNLFSLVETELGDDYFSEIENHLKELKFRRGVLVSAELGQGNEGTNYVLRKPTGKPSNWVERLLRRGPRTYTFSIAERDEAGARALSELRDRGINLVANALAQSMEHILSFVEMLRTELAFYVGCLNLHAKLREAGQPTCFPRPESSTRHQLHFSGLYDVSLALTMGRNLVGNAAEMDGKRLVIITGANQGGKSSFLRGIGLAQVMMQAGMFVGAESFTGDTCAALFTHYRREEDTAMKSGKLDEELSRVSKLADAFVPQSVVLFNESFAATNEREGSEIAEQVVSAFLRKQTRIFFVTHLYEFARRFLERHPHDVMFMRAERRADGTRTFRILEGEPLETSYGEDLYRRVFGQREADAVEATSAGAFTDLSPANESAGEGS